MGSSRRFGACVSPVFCIHKMAAAEEEPTYDVTDAGASATYPQQAGEIRKGSHLMIKGRPCKCVEVSTSKTGKHGHAKAHIVALDIFTNKKYQDLCPTSHNVEVPFVKKTELQVLSADASSGEVSLLLETGETKDDLNLPDKDTKCGATTDDQQKDDEKVAKEICEATDKGEKTVIAIVQSACGLEKIIGVKLT